VSNRLEFLDRIDALTLNAESHPFFARYTEEFDLAVQVLAREPGLQIYTLTAWGYEVWVHRGSRLTNRLGFVVGRRDLGVGFKELLWTEPYDD
jgi:hypothetical protein